MRTAPGAQSTNGGLIIKMVRSRKDLGQYLTGLTSDALSNALHYLDGDGAGRATMFKARNFSASQPDAIAAELRLLTLRRGFSKEKRQNSVFHFILSRRGQTDPQQLVKMAERLLLLLGLECQRALIAVHNDTSNDHVHIVADAFDHDGRKIELNRRWTKTLLAHANARLCFEFNLEPERGLGFRANHLGVFGSDNVMVRDAAFRPVGTCQLPGKAGVRPSFAQREQRLGREGEHAALAAIALRARETSTCLLHFVDQMAAAGFQYKAHGSGAVFVDLAGRAVRASHVSACLSRSRMLKRFGEPNLPSGPLVGHSALKELTEERLRAGDGEHLLPPGNPRHDEELRCLAMELRQPETSYSEVEQAWLTERLEQAARQMTGPRRGRPRRPRHFFGEALPPITPVDMFGLLCGRGEPRLVWIDTWRPGDRVVQQGQVKTVLRGHKPVASFAPDLITLHSRDPDDLEAALRIAEAQWGEIRLYGSREFQLKAAKMAAQLGIKVADARLEAYVAHHAAKVLQGIANQRRAVDALAGRLRAAALARVNNAAAVLAEPVRHLRRSIQLTVGAKHRQLGDQRREPKHAIARRVSGGQQALDVLAPPRPQLAARRSELARLARRLAAFRSLPQLGQALTKVKAGRAIGMVTGNGLVVRLLGSAAQDPPIMVPAAFIPTTSSACDEVTRRVQVTFAAEPSRQNNHVALEFARQGWTAEFHNAVWDDPVEGAKLRAIHANAETTRRLKREAELEAKREEERRQAARQAAAQAAATEAYRRKELAFHNRVKRALKDEIGKQGVGRLDELSLRLWPPHDRFYAEILLKNPKLASQLRAQVRQGTPQGTAMAPPVAERPSLGLDWALKTGPASGHPSPSAGQINPKSVPSSPVAVSLPSQPVLADPRRARVADKIDQGRTELPGKRVNSDSEEAPPVPAASQQLVLQSALPKPENADGSGYPAQIALPDKKMQEWLASHRRGLAAPFGSEPINGRAFRSGGTNPSTPVEASVMQRAEAKPATPVANFGLSDQTRQQLRAINAVFRTNDWDWHAYARHRQEEAVRSYQRSRAVADKAPPPSQQPASEPASQTEQVTKVTVNQPSPADLAAAAQHQFNLSR